MNGESNTERELKQLLPQPPLAAPPELRAAVLLQITVELSRKRERYRTRCWALGAACLLLIGVFVNVGVLQYGEQRLQTLCGPAPVPRVANELFHVVAEVADQETATQLQQQWLAIHAQQTRDPDEFARLYAAQTRMLNDEWNWMD